MSTAHIGKPVSRVDGRAKVTGEARYAAEYPVPGLAYGWVISSPIARGTGTSKRGRSSVSTIRAATSPGSIHGRPRIDLRPDTSSVLVSDGSTIEISTPLPCSSCATASEKPATPNFVAT